MCKVTITIKHGRVVSHLQRKYDRSFLLDEAEQEVFIACRDYLAINSLWLDYIGGWEWAVKIDDRTIAFALWTAKG